MRKQTKLVAVASAAALLAVGASMTSFAATGWVEEDGQWFFYDRDGNRVEDTWKKSGDNWYWLDSEEGGAMAIDKLIDDGEDTYYVDSNGVMVRNTWVKVVNEDQDDDTDPAEYVYYYMQSNGKAYKTSSESTQFKTIDGKRYAFDEDGKMLYGWVNRNHERVEDDEWDDPDTLYYLGQWDDGAMKTGWQKIYVEDHKDDDEEKEFWFNFKSNGQKRKADPDEVTEKKINGRTYGFDERGVMTYEWTIVATDAGTRNAASVSDWKYFNNPEDGARVTKGWFKVVAPEEDNDNMFAAYDDHEGWSFAYNDADEENERWYYADGNGKLYQGAIKKIKGKYYGFRPENDPRRTSRRGAAMLTGLTLLEVKGSDIISVLDDDVDGDDLDLIIDDNQYYEDGEKTDIKHMESGSTISLFYFGNDEDTDGAMKTGNVTVNIDGDNQSFKFSTSGGAEGKGRGLTGMDDKKYVYKYGLRLKASSDDKFLVVYVDGNTADKGARVAKISSQELRDIAKDTKLVNKDGDNVSVLGDGNHSWLEGFRLLTTSGSIVKNKTAARDGADWYFYVKDNHIVMYANTKTLTASNDKEEPNHTDNVAGLDKGLSKWKDKDPDGRLDFTDALGDSEGSSFDTLNDYEGYDIPEPDDGFIKYDPNEETEETTSPAESDAATDN